MGPGVGHWANDRLSPSPKVTVYLSFLPFSWALRYSLVSYYGVYREILNFLGGVTVSAKY